MALDIQARVPGWQGSEANMAKHAIFQVNRTAAAVAVGAPERRSITLEEHATRVPVVGHGKKEAKKGITEDEGWLQEMIAQNPVLIQSVMGTTSEAEWNLVGQDVRIRGIGAIDILFITGSGRPVIVETKLAKNPESRRQVLAQIAEYGLHLARLSASELLADAEEDPSLTDLMPAIDEHLVRGQLDVIIVGDEIDERLVPLAHKLLIQNQVFSPDLYFIEMALFLRPGGDVLVSPRLVIAAPVEERRVVKLTFEGTQAADVKIEPVVFTPPGPRRGKTDIDTVIRSIRDRRGNSSEELARYLLRILPAELGAEQLCGSSAVSVRMPDPRGSGRLLTLYVVSEVGTFYTNWLSRWDVAGPMAAAAAARYRAELTALFGERVIKGPTQAWSAVPLDDVRAKRDEVVELIRTAVRSIEGSARQPE